MPSRHSTVVGGSSAARLLNCPGSTALLAKLPQVADRDSFYSLEGTALHTAIEQLITGKLTLARLREGPIMIATHAGAIEVTPALTRDTLEPAWDYWQALLDRVDVWQLETEVRFPGIKGAFGTADVIAHDRIKNITYVTDWKFGAGVGVLAVYPDPDDSDYEIVNEQLMFYATAARHTQPEFFPPGCKVILTIVQPRARGHDPITSVEVTLDDLDVFASDLRSALAITAPTVKRGRWCEFMACQTICPLWTGPLLDLNAITQTTVALSETDPGYQRTLLDILAAAPGVEDLIREARSQAHLIMANGGELPGWKLVAKRANRQWTVGPDVIAKKLKIPLAKLYDKVLKSPAGVEKLLPAKTKVPEALAVATSSGTTIAPADDKRPAIAADPGMLSKILVDALAASE